MSPQSTELLQGTLDMLVLRTLLLGPAHGYTIAHSIEQGSEEVLQIEHGSLYVGAPETVARRIATTAKALGVSRFHMKYSAGTLSHEKIMRCIELYGRKVIPLTCDMLA